MPFDMKSLVQVINIVAKLIPPPQRPKPDYESLYQSIPDYSKLLAVSPSPAMTLPEGPAPVTVVDAKPISVEKKAVATSCMSCSRSHLTTIAGALDEALRFARSDGMASPEVLRRIDDAEREVVIMERIDLSPEAIQNSPQEEQDFIRPFMNKIRELRQNIGQIRSVDQLEKTAANAITVSREFKTAQMGLGTQEEPAVVEPDEDRVKAMETRLRQYQANGVNLNPVIQLAQQVKAGTISIEEAREKVRQLLPEEA